jgi:hypothetical protein
MCVVWWWKVWGGGREGGRRSRGVAKREPRYCLAPPPASYFGSYPMVARVVLVAVCLAGAAAAPLSQQAGPNATNAVLVSGPRGAALAAEAMAPTDCASYLATPPASMVGIDNEWCNQNCPLGNCPQDMCECGREAQGNAANQDLSGLNDAQRARRKEREKLQAQRREARAQRKAQTQQRLHPELQATPKPLPPAAAAAAAAAEAAKAAAERATKHKPCKDMKCRQRERRALKDAHRYGPFALELTAPCHLSLVRAAP